MTECFFSCKYLRFRKYRNVNVFILFEHVHGRIFIRGFTMRILEARESFIKFESEENILLSSFVEITDLDKS